MNALDDIQIEDIFAIVRSLYKLPINVRQVREQFAQLPRKSCSLKIILRFKIYFCLIEIEYNVF